MTSQLITIITSPDPETRNHSVDAFARAASLTELLAECAALDAFRRASDNLYERVRALFFLYAIHRFHLPGKEGIAARGLVPYGLTRDDYWNAYHAELDRLGKLPKGSGGDFYLTLGARASKRFARALVVSALEGRSSFTEAFRLLGFKKMATFRELGQSLGVGV